MLFDCKKIVNYIKLLWYLLDSNLSCRCLWTSRSLQFSRAGHTHETVAGGQVTVQQNAGRTGRPCLPISVVAIWSICERPSSPLVCIGWPSTRIMASGPWALKRGEKGMLVTLVSLGSNCPSLLSFVQVCNYLRLGSEQGKLIMDQCKRAQGRSVQTHCLIAP